MWTIHAAWIPTFPDNERPFAWVQDMYEERARMKAEGNPAQKALKLSLNSLYGKTAQSAGARKHKDGTWTKPKWHNSLWAGWVTAAVRSRLMSATRRNHTRLVAFETDAIFTMKPLDTVTIGEGLGEYEFTDIERILYIHSGVYYALQDDGLWRHKSRGMEIDKSKSADYWLEIFAQLPETPVTLTTTIRRFGTDIRQPERYGNWYDHVTTTKIPDSWSKRMHFMQSCPTCVLAPKILKRSFSYAERPHWLMVPEIAIDSDWLESTPYHFPWRTDVDYEWPEVFTSDAIEGSAEEGLTWQ
jgi:hypothetical protein